MNPRSHLFVSLAALGLTACPAKSSDPADPKSKPQSQEAAKPAPPPPGVIARVNGKDLPKDYFDRMSEQSMARYRRADQELPDGVKLRVRRSVLRRMISDEILRQEAEKAKVEVSDAELQENWRLQKQRYGSEEAFESFLQRSKQKEADLIAQFKLNIIRARLFEHITKDVTVSDEEVRKAFDKNAGRYKHPATMSASHILIRVPSKATKAERAKLKKQAQKLLAKVRKAGPKGFAELAKTNSEDSSKDRGGDLGAFTKGQMVPPFEAAVKALKVGQISKKLVETNFGYHIILKTGEQPEREESFDEVKDKIRNSLLARYRNDLITGKMKSWEESAKVEDFFEPDVKVGKPGPTPRRNKNAPLGDLRLIHDRPLFEEIR